MIGAGVSGLTAAHVLTTTHAVTVFEADARLGGHAHTHDVPAADGRTLRVDSGFIVHNDRTYPRLLRLFRELDVPTRPTEMSMSITCDGLRAVVRRRPRARAASSPSHAGSPTARFLRMLAQVPRFHRAARALLEADDRRRRTPPRASSSRAGAFPDYFVRHFALPLVACVWSAGDADAAGYPARYLFRFLDHHGMLTVSGSPPGAPSSAARRPTSTRWPRGCPTCAAPAR